MNQVSPVSPVVVIRGELAGKSAITCNGDEKRVRSEILDQVLRQNPGLRKEEFHWSCGVLYFTLTNEPVAGSPIVKHKNAHQIRKESVSQTHVQSSGGARNKHFRFRPGGTRSNYK